MHIDVCFLLKTSSNSLQFDQKIQELPSNVPGFHVYVRKTTCTLKQQEHCNDKVTAYGSIKRLNTSHSISDLMSFY